MDKENVFGNQLPELPFERTPIIGGIIKETAKRIDGYTATEGISKGIRKALEERGAHISSHFESPETDKILHEEKCPVILVTTHSSLAEPLAVLSSLSDGDKARNDISAVVADGMPQYPNLDKYFLPLYNTAPTKGFRPDTTLFKSLGGRALFIEKENATDLNIRTLETAGENMKAGNLIFISPEGNQPKDSAWSPAGIGRLLANIGLNSGGVVIFADAQGADMIEMAKLMNPFSSPKPFKDVKVRFSAPMSIDTIIGEGGNKKTTITANLNKQYGEWVKNKSPQPVTQPTS